MAKEPYQYDLDEEYDQDNRKKKVKLYKGSMPKNEDTSQELALWSTENNTTRLSKTKLKRRLKKHKLKWLQSLKNFTDPEEFKQKYEKKYLKLKRRNKLGVEKAKRNKSVSNEKRKRFNKIKAKSIE